MTNRTIPADVAAARQAGLDFLRELGAVEDAGFARQLVGLLVADAIRQTINRLNRDTLEEGFEQTLTELTEDVVNCIAEEYDLRSLDGCDF
jgi:hypothetical protein